VTASVAGIIIFGERGPPAASLPTSPRAELEVKLLRPIGIWQLDETRGKGRTTTKAFRFDGKTVTLFLVARNEFSARPPDDYYRVRARWRGDELYIQYPSGIWGPLVSCVGGRFIDRRMRAGPVFIYRKVRPRELDKSNRALLRDRPLWDYSTSLNDDWR
jgi:hypothetical protein